MSRKRKQQADEPLDERTIAEMNLPGMPRYEDPEAREKRTSVKETNVTRAERRAMVKGAFLALLPIYLVGLLIFCLAFGAVMLYFWLVK